jgi:hypothetical protein
MYRPRANPRALVIVSGVTLAIGACGGGDDETAGPGPGAPDDPTPPPAGVAPTFSRHVLPVLAANCVGCHGGSGGLDLVDHASVMRGGDAGLVVVAGRPGESRLTLSMRSRAEDAMPPGNPVREALIAMLERWIAAGAHDD